MLSHELPDSAALVLPAMLHAPGCAPVQHANCMIAMFFLYVHVTSAGVQALVGSATHLTTAEQFDGWEELLPSKIRSTSLTAGAGGGDDC